MSLRAVQDGDHVLLLVHGQLVGRLHHAKAREVADAVRSVALLAEEWGEAERVAQDAAILMRAGSPICLTSFRAIRDEAFNRAQWDPGLRRYMPPPSSVKSRESFGRPSITNHGGGR